MRIEAEVTITNGWLYLRKRIVSGLVVVTDFFGTPRNNLAGKHTGMDVAPGDAFPADADIEIRLGEGALEWVVPDGGRLANGGVGNMVQVRYPDGEGGRVFHLREFAPRIQAWIDGGYDAASRPWIEPDEVVGIMGNTGFVYGAGGAVPAPGDLHTGLHAHWEHLVGQQAINVLERIDDVDEVVYRVPTSPIPPQVVEPEPLNLELVPAWNEARLLKRLIGMMIDSPVPGGIGDALDVVMREAEEIVAAHGATAGATLDEARVLVQTARVLRDAGAPGGYGPTLEAMRTQAQELADALRAGTPA